MRHHMTRAALPATADRGGFAPASPARALALMAALFAVTLNILQPLAHAASMRDGTPGMARSALCEATAADPDRGDAGTSSAPAPAMAKHECCLGLASGPSLIAPSAVYVTSPPVATALPPFLPVARGPAFAIRDGPTQPRAPPLID